MEQNTEVMVQNNKLLEEINNNLKLLVEHLVKNSGEKKKKTKVKKEKKVKTYSTKSYGNKKTYLTEYQNAILMHGNTFDFKDVIKSKGGFWNSLNKGWVLSTDVKDDIMCVIEGIVSTDGKMDKELKDEYGEPFVIGRKSSPKLKEKPKKKENNKSNCLFDSDSD